MVILPPYAFQNYIFYGIVFHFRISNPTLSIFSVLSVNILSITLIYHMVLKNLQKKFVYERFLLP
jgi:hypothetical protein